MTDKITPAQRQRQRWFDQAATGLLRQGRKSMIHSKFSKFCRYRGDGDTRCAIGFLIEDEDYNEDMEERNVSEPEIIEAIGYDRTLGNLDDHVADQHFLERLQEVHDNYEVNDWPAALKRLAANYGLSAAAVETHLKGAGP